MTFAEIYVVVLVVSPLAGFGSPDGWMVLEHPEGRIERLCPADEFRVADYPPLAIHNTAVAVKRLIVYAGANGAGSSKRRWKSPQCRATRAPLLR